jgi:hypothetical protein
MLITTSTAQKYWLYGNSAATQLILIPRSLVVATATLSAVEGSGPAWARIADARSGSLWNGSPTFGAATTLRTTTDRLAVQVFAADTTKAAAVATVFRYPALPASETIENGAHLPIEEILWAAHTEDGTIRAVHSVVQFDGAAPLGRGEAEELLGGDGLRLAAFTPTEFVRDGLRVDPATGRVQAG